MAVEEADSSDKDAGALDDVAMQTCGNGATGSKKSNSQGYADTHSRSELQNGAGGGDQRSFHHQSAGS